MKPTSGWPTRQDPPATAATFTVDPAVENQIDSLVRQLSNSSVRPAATESPSATETMTDRQLIDRCNELFQLFKDGPLIEPTIDFAAVAQPTVEAEAMARRGRWGQSFQLHLVAHEPAPPRR